MSFDTLGSGQIVAPYGSWKSPITADFVTSQVVGLSELHLDGADMYWLEQRPSEKGRTVIVRADLSSSAHEDVIPQPFNSRSRVHEYGGGSCLASHGKVYFSNFADNRLYVTNGAAAPSPITDDSARWRFADFILDKAHQRLIAVGEDHDPERPGPTNLLVGLPISGGPLVVLTQGHDFYASPKLSPDGAQLAFLTWNHPNMPWDGTQLWTASILPDGSLGAPILIAGGVDESIFQPEWSPDGILYYVSDRDGWWNLYRMTSDVGEKIWSKDAEFGEPQWVFGMTTYAFAGPDTVICTYTHDGAWYLASIDTISGKVSEIETTYTVISSVKANEHTCCFIGASPRDPASVVSLDLDAGKYTVLKRSSQAHVPDSCLSMPEPIKFVTSDGQSAFANYYPPKNDSFSASEGELPPLLVACHGGPTSASYSQLNLNVQYWTSRGFAFVQVNYGGSTGYGREYRERLNGEWGLVDVQDCVNCALTLAENGKADVSRLTIHGGSAGGYTALCALTFHRVFAAGASLYGVSDLELLAKDTHKFEAKYLDRLVGPYPERVDIYRERSPIYFADKLSAPVIFFQGLDDKVVPPNQAVAMVEALKSQNIPVAYVPFEGEGHGFRRSDSIKRCLEAHLYFYAAVLGIDLPQVTEKVEIYGF